MCHITWKGVLLTLIGIVAFIYICVRFDVPRNDRTWLPEYAVLPGITVTSDHTFSIQNERDFEAEPDGSTSSHYFGRSVDANQVTRVSFFVEPLPGTPAFAHTFFSFDFKNGPPLVVSVETRKEVTESSFDPVRGLERQYELVYVFSTEEDEVARVIKTSDRRLSMYPLEVSPGAAGKLLMSLATRAQTVETHPAFYNTFTDNCTSILADAANDVVPGTLPWSFARIFTGHAANFLIEHGFINATSTKNADIRELVLLTSNVDVSNAIRAHVFAQDK